MDEPRQDPASPYIPLYRPGLPFYARRVVEDLVQKTLPLDRLPHQGRMVPELKEASIRELPLYSYRILYEVKANNLILVLAVIHKRRDLSPEKVPREQV